MKNFGGIKICLYLKIQKTAHKGLFCSLQSNPAQLTQDGDYDIQQKKLTNVAEGTLPNEGDIITTRRCVSVYLGVVVLQV